MRRPAVAVPVLLLLLITTGCAGSPQASVPTAFLAQHGIQTQASPSRFTVKVPSSWDVPLGAYPEGLYWGLANVFSQDIGLDLTRLKGQTVQAWRYPLQDGLPGEGEHKRFSYPSDVIVLVSDQTVVGAWLAFNTTAIGPSLKLRNLEEITGLTFDQWVDRERYFTQSGANTDLAELGPVEVLRTFLDAITAGDRTRAQACLSPRGALNSLTMNQNRDSRLYNAGFSHNNSMAQSIRRGKLLGHKLVDPDSPAVAVTEVGDRTRIEIVADVELVWRDEVFNPPTGRTVRFAIVQKSAIGWKLDGLGTGP